MSRVPPGHVDHLLPLLHGLLVVDGAEVCDPARLEHVVHRHPALRVPGHDVSLVVLDIANTIIK